MAASPKRIRPSRRLPLIVTVALLIPVVVLSLYTASSPALSRASEWAAVAGGRRQALLQSDTVLRGGELTDAQADVDALVAADWASAGQGADVDVGHGVAAADAAARLARACAAARQPDSGVATLTLPQLWWTEARQAAFVAWYRHVFRSTRAGSTGTRAPNASAFVGNRILRQRLGEVAEVLAAPGSIAVHAGVLISSLVDLSPAFAVRVDVEAGCRLAVDCAAVEHAGTPACDNAAMWAPGFAIVGAAPLLRAFPGLRATRSSGGAMRSGGGDLTGSVVWDAVALHALACREKLGRGDGGGGEWVPYSCLQEAQDGIAPLAVAGTGDDNATYTTHPRLWQHHTVRGLWDATSSGGTPSATTDAAVRRLTSQYPHGTHRHWAPPRVATVVDSAVFLEQWYYFVVRGALPAAAPTPAATPLPLASPLDILAVGECIDGQVLATTRAAAPGWANVVVAESMAVPPLPRLALLRHSLASYGNFFHALAEGVQPMWALADYAAAVTDGSVGGGVTLGVHQWATEHFQRVVTAAGVRWLESGPFIDERRRNGSGAGAAASAGSGAANAVETANATKAPPALVAVPIGRPPVGNSRPGYGAIAADALLIVDGASCQWPGVLTTLLGREAIRRRLGLPPPDMRQYWPPPGAAHASARVAAAAALTRSGLCAAHPRARAPLPMTAAAVAQGCPSALARSPRVLVIRRAKKRVLVDEAALLEAFAALGGDPVIALFDDAALPSTEASWRHFGGADVVVGPHGAAMANVIAAQSGAALLEFTHASNERRYFGFLSGVLGLSWDEWTTAAARDDPVRADTAAVSAAYCVVLRRSLSVEVCDATD